MPKSKNPAGFKLIKVPAGTHAMVLELRRLMAERGDSAYWLRENGTTCHGPLSAAPIHVAVTWAVRSMLQFMSEHREDVARASEARQEYVEGFEEPKPEEEEGE